MGEDTRIIDKGTVLYRITNSIEDKTFGRRKFFSLTEEDHIRWRDTLGRWYVENSYTFYAIQYVSLRNLQIAKDAVLQKMFSDDRLKDEQFARKIIYDAEIASKILDYDVLDVLDALSINIAVQNESGILYIERLISLGYDGTEDRHGRNISKDPIAIFDPDDKVKPIEIN